MSRVITIVLLVLITTSCQKDKGKEFEGNYLVQLTIHTQHAWLVPSSDTSTLWISTGDSTQPWQFSSIGKNQYSISPTGNNYRVLSADSSSIAIIIRPASLTDKESFYIDKNNNSEVSFRSAASGNVINVAYAEKNNTIWGYSVNMMAPGSCILYYSGSFVDTQWCIPSFKLSKK
jgi:hypothetical protein